MPSLLYCEDLTALLSFATPLVLHPPRLYPKGSLAFAPRFTHTNRLHLWVCEADGTGRVFNLSGGKSILVGERINAIPKRNEHNSAVRYIVRAGNSAFKAAEEVDSDVRWSRAVFSHRTVNTVVRSIGVMPLFVRDRYILEKASVTVLDSNLQFSDLD